MPRRSDADEGQESAVGLTAFESRLLKLLALVLVQDHKQPHQISLLNRAGFRPFEIARLLGTTPNTVRVQLSVQKRAKKGGPARG